MRLTIAENVAVRALAHPDRLAIELSDGGEALTYGQCWRRIAALAEAIGTVEAGPHGAMVGLLLPNQADAVLAYFITQKLHLGVSRPLYGPFHHTSPWATDALLR